MVSDTDTPWIASDPLEPTRQREIRREMMFEHFKWDPQMQDVSTLGATPLVLRCDAWQGLVRNAEALYHETLLIEQALLDRPKLIGSLTMPGRIRRVLQSGGPWSVPGPRVMRFDFHHTTAGWRVTEVNSDVPGGHIEAGAYTELVGRSVANARPTGDPTHSLIAATGKHIGSGKRIALVYATAYSDDAQVMFYLARAFEQAGHEVIHAAPDNPQWASADIALRFYPAEWLANLPKATRWRRFFADGPIPLSNPGTALLTQNKRWPLVLDQLGVDAPAWRALSPETRAVDHKRVGDAGWVVKPALGRVGGGIGMQGCTTSEDWRKIRLWSRLYPGGWIMQRRFTPTPWQTAQGPCFPCLGVYVVDGEAAGVYGRASLTGLVDHSAVDLAVLVETGDAMQQQNAEHTSTEARSCASTC